MTVLFGIVVLMLGILQPMNMYFKNIQSVALYDLLPVLGIFAFLTLSLFAICRALIKDFHRAMLLTAVTLLTYLVYNLIYNNFSTLKLSSTNLRLGGIYTLMYIGVFVYAYIRLKRLNKSPTTLMRFLTAFTVAIYLSYLPYLIGIRAIDEASINQMSDLSSIELSEPKERRNVIIVVLDSYPRKDTLQRVYGFDNTPFLNELKKRGLFILDAAFSNYSTTFLSLPALFNMSYLNDELKHLKDESDRFIPDIMITHNRLSRSFKQIGYQVINIRSGWGPTNKLISADENWNDDIGSEYFLAVIEDNRPLKKLYKLSLSNEITSALFGRKRISNGFELLKRFGSQAPYGTGHLVFAHFLLPHPPYLFGPNGENVMTNSLKFDGNSWLLKQPYVDQLKYANGKILEVLDELLKAPVKPVILLTGDHGSAFHGASDEYWSPNALELVKERMSIFTAIYAPNSGLTEIEQLRTPVNYMRAILNTYFGTQLEMLENRSYFSSYVKPYDFTDVTEVVD